MDTPDTAAFELASQRLGGLPLINHFLARTGLVELLARYLPAADARDRLAPAVAVRLVITNLLVGRQPLYLSSAQFGTPRGPGAENRQVEPVGEVDIRGTA